MEAGLKREEKQPFLPESAPYLDGARATLKIMKEAPVIIFITDPLASPMDQPLAVDERVSEICNAQSVGAAIENMTLPQNWALEVFGSVIRFLLRKN